MTTSYAGASAHYLSPRRRDPVKRHWEEPVNHRILARALGFVEGDPVRVVDVGSGTGDGLALLEAITDRPLDYLGLDPDPEMITTAGATHEGRDGVRFLQADVRDDLDLAPDLWLSAGAPWSHLDHHDFRTTLVRLLRAAARRDRPTALVVDTLGRWSMEWPAHWDDERWDYRMSFFQGAGDDPVAAPMSTHTRWTIDAAVLEADVPLAALEFHDRSITVGRHTSTAAFHPGLTDYRGLVNALHDGDTGPDLADLRLDPPSGPAPREVESFFAAFAALWNARLDRATEQEAALGSDPSRRRVLAADLCALEHGAAPGLGVGHSLIALIVVAP
ncbi:class I SAM-dependent methyltransferase [Actinomycetospora corticicola]|uniref:SAM-dependent methyltransferase n=1 Tax=Actinomycetospora corticicola TaxID=663602 RepID=A0A7Y9J3T5_9PSEU|nr:class I SAM-dependent methyltransferase [Actinomycetospora corticicola]NYD34315.1 SAM-dependent methyltransferase [Actinomycetospora corticicola]